MQPSANDITVLRELARRLAAVANTEAMAAKRAAVMAHNRLRLGRPLVYCFPEGAWLECISWDSLACTDPLLRTWEMRLRMALYTHEQLRDDQPLDAVFNVPWDGGFDGWGVEVKTQTPDAGSRRTYYIHPYSNLSLSSHSELGAAHYDAPLTDKRMIEQLRTPQLILNRETSSQWLAAAHEIFDGILEVRRRCAWWNTVGGPPARAIQFRGMDNLMLDMYDDPAWVHALVQRLCAGHNAMLDALEAADLLSLNNGCEWIHTGGIGYTDEIPGPEFDPAHVRCRDLWGGMESQDLVGLSPAMYEEFFFPYLQPILERFALANYGCCEPLHDWLPILQRARNLRRVSVSPWADVRKCAEQCAGRYIMSVKPNPAALCLAQLDEAAIAAGIRDTFQVAKANGCAVEIMIKDLHTVKHEPARLARWVVIAQRVRDEVYGG